jgi:fatty acid desaturase
VEQRQRDGHPISIGRTPERSSSAQSEAPALYTKKLQSAGPADCNSGTPRLAIHIAIVLAALAGLLLPALLSALMLLTWLILAALLLLSGLLLPALLRVVLLLLVTLRVLLFVRHVHVLQ